MSQVYLLIGGNQGNRLQLLKRAKELIQNACGKIVKESSVYESEPWGFEADQNFLNQVIIVSTELGPMNILDKCQQIENELGRVRNDSGYASRTMDIDILFIDDKIIETKRLIVPHEHLHKRRFTLSPLSELSADFIHPKLNKSMIEMLKECPDQSNVIKL
jgi:2-amino-4-hydroxy-6-hydroxymethyldihydropteridine diphosphokinase